MNMSCFCVSFLEALKRNLREKIEKLNLDVPPMCFCGPTIWDTNPDTCANNCIFYKNPKRKNVSAVTVSLSVFEFQCFTVTNVIGAVTTFV